MTPFFSLLAVALAAVVVRYVVVPRLAWREPPRPSQLRHRQLDALVRRDAVEWPGEAIDAWRGRP